MPEHVGRDVGILVRIGPICMVYSLILLSAWVLGQYLVFPSYTIQFWGLTLFLALFHLSELVTLYRRDPRFFFVRPVVLGAIILFLLQFGGITNFLMRRRDGEFATLYNNILDHEPRWLCYAMALALAASVAYWLGYKLNTGSRIYRIYTSVYDRFWQYKVSHIRLLIGWLIGCAVKLVINQYGAIGHKYIILTLERAYIPPFVTRLKVFENLSLLFFVMLLYVYRQQRHNVFLRMVVIMAFVFELAFALTSGARFTIVMLFLSVFLVDYIITGRLKLIWVLVLSGVLYVSMTFIAGYKDYIFHDRRQVLQQQGTIETFREAMLYNIEKQAGKRVSEDIREAVRISVIARFNYVNELAQMVRYKRVVGLGREDPDFIFPFLTFPVFAVLPKYYLFGVQEPGYGYWATERLSGGRRTSTAISPIAFSYLAGGPVLVFVVFGLLGILMKWVGLLIHNINTVVGLVLFLSLMSVLAMFDSVVTGAFINLIRYSLLLPIVLWVFLSRPGSGSGKLEGALS